MKRTPLATGRKVGKCIESMFVGYLLLLMLPAIMLPPDILSAHPWLKEFVNILSVWVPSIQLFSSISEVPEVAACSWAITWITAPYLICLNALNPRNPARDPQFYQRARQYPRSRFQCAVGVFLFLIALIFLSQIAKFSGGSSGNSWLESLIRLTADSRLWLAVVCTSFGIALGGTVFGLHFSVMAIFSKDKTNDNR